MIWSIFQGMFKAKYLCSQTRKVNLRNKSWKPECVGSFNMG